MNANIMSENIKEYLRRYIHQWCGRLNLATPKVKFRRMRYYGNCDFIDHVITINTLITNRYGLEDTCRHEILHLINATHNRHFLESAQKLGLYRGWTYERFKARCK